MKAYSLDFRQKIIETYENEPISQRDLAERFRVAPSFVTKLLKQYRETGDLNPKPRSGRPRTLQEEQLQVVEALVEAQNDITLGEFCEALNQQLNVTVSEATMCRVMQGLHLTRKKKALHPSEKGSDRVQQARAAYWEAVRDVRVQDLVFVDESGVNLGLMRLFAWALKGERAHGAQPKRGKNVSLVADNCSIHQEAVVRPLIEAVGARLVFLPPYSPDFSPIENFWSKVKNTLKTLGARTYQALSESIDKAFADVSETDSRNWFAHCCYCSS